MNLAAYAKGVISALRGGEGWRSEFDLTRKGLQHSFIAVALMVPFLYVCALAVTKNRAQLEGTDIVNGVPLAPFAIIFAIYALSFSVTAYVLALIFDRQDRFRPWVIVRHWAFFFTAVIAGIVYGLYLLNVMPFGWASSIAIAIYLSTLLIDIRLAQRIAGFEWGPAILTACIITAMGLTILLTGVAQFI